VSKQIPRKSLFCKNRFGAFALLILASTSTYRAQLVARLGFDFSTEASGVAEHWIEGESSAERAMRLARAKASAVAARFPEAWVLGSDQVAECNGRVHDKPGDAAHCRAQLRASSGGSVEFHTAAVLRRHASNSEFAHLDRTTVRFRELTDAEIAAYVQRDQPYDCAGGFRCEGLGIALFNRIESSDPTALIGLPLIWVAGALRTAGLDPLRTQA
jgi:septum formation protein